jgi:hypothetical protein
LSSIEALPLHVTLRSLAPNTPDTSDGFRDLFPSTEMEKDVAFTASE